MNIAQGRVKYTQGNGKYKQVSANFGAAVENYERAVENYESAVENYESLIGNCETSVPLSVVSKVGNFRTKKKGAYLFTTMVIYHGASFKSARHSSSSSSSVSPSPYLTPNRGFVPLLYVHAVRFVSRLNP